MRKLSVYASSTGTEFGAQPENYGDNLMVPLLRGLFGVDPCFVPMEKAELIGVGSILDSYHRRRTLWQRLRNSWPRRDLHVWGSGFMNEGGRPLWPQRITVHAVRGPLSRNKVKRPLLPIGDPAILLPRIWRKPATTTAGVAIIPHFVTYRDFVETHGRNLPRHWQVINLLDEPETVTNQIAGAEIVVSSSLHGLIVADAYGVPAVRLAGDKRIKGDGFKYRDYEAFRGEQYGAAISANDVFIRPLRPAEPRLPPPDVCDRLMGAFPFK